MQFYDNAEELLNDAVQQGFIRLSHITIHINNVDIDTPNAIIIVNMEKWKSFLQNIIDNTDSQDEINFAKRFLQPIKTLDNVNTSQLQSCQPTNELRPILESQMSTSASNSDLFDKTIQSINACKTIDDIIALMNDVIPTKLSWKKPVRNEFGKLRYHCHNTKWFIELQEKRRNDCYYSIFSPQEKEVARYDTLKDAKDNMLSIINYFKK